MHDDPVAREHYVTAGSSFEYPIYLWVFECAVNVFRVMLQEVGLNRILEGTKHYNHAWARAVLGMVRERFGDMGSDMETIAMTGHFAHHCTSYGHIKPLEIREGGAITELYACPTPGMSAPPEMCVAMSHVMAEGWCQAINPDYECIFTHHLANGDDCCRWVVMKKGSGYSLDKLGRLEKTIPLELSVEEMESFGARMVVFGQLFNFTAVANELIGPQRTMELVAPLSRETGLKLGDRLIEGVGGRRDLSTIRDMMDFLGTNLDQCGSPSMIIGSSIEREITDCPCKGAPSEVCKLFEGVFNGVCEAIEPDYEFAYDRMMSQGDSTCHWVVKKKGGRQPEVRGPGTQETALELLKKRLVRGEIGSDEYRRLRDVLLEK